MTAFQNDPLVHGKWYASTGNRQTAAENVFSPPFDSEEEANHWAKANQNQSPQFFVWQFTGEASPAFTGK